MQTARFTALIVFCLIAALGIALGAQNCSHGRKRARPSAEKALGDLVLLPPLLRRAFTLTIQFRVVRHRVKDPQRPLIADPHIAAVAFEGDDGGIIFEGCQVDLDPVIVQRDSGQLVTACFDMVE